MHSLNNRKTQTPIRPVRRERFSSVEVPVDISRQHRKRLDSKICAAHTVETHSYIL